MVVVVVVVGNLERSIAKVCVCVCCVHISFTMRAKVFFFFHSFYGRNRNMRVARTSRAHGKHDNDQRHNKYELENWKAFKENFVKAAHVHVNERACVRRVRPHLFLCTIKLQTEKKNCLIFSALFKINPNRIFLRNTQLSSRRPSERWRKRD